MQENSLLEIRHLSVTFHHNGRETIAVDSVSFRVGKKEILGIVGESGSGKSVTALSVLGLIPNPPGKVEVEAIRLKDSSGGWIRLDHLSERELQQIRGRKVSMIFQEPMTSLNPVFPCGDQVSETLRHHLGMSKKEARQRSLELFSEVSLPDPPRIFRSYPHELSGGQKQRVMIAMAISCNPSLLIADEPTTALDVSVQKTILELLKRLQQQREMSIIFITHDLGLISRFADRILVMYQGRIIEEGTVNRVFGSPEQPYTQGLIACRPPLGLRLKRLPTVSDYLEGKQLSAESEQVAGGSWQGSTIRPPASGIWREIVSPEQRFLEHQKLYNAEPILKVKHVGKQFSSKKGWLERKEHPVRAVNDVSFFLFPGETLGIVGESGCGKTTLSRVILQLIPPSEGRILYRDRDITTLTRHALKVLHRELQIVFQDPYSSLNPRMAVGEAIREPMEVHHLYGNKHNRINKVHELLLKVGLQTEHYYRYPHEFSGGQRQRICIARALAVDPRLIICDESVSALDISIQAQILNLLNDLKHEFRLTYIFISHDLNVVNYMADRLIVMKNGKIVEMGDPDEIYRNPKSEYTRVLLEANR
ncbi:MAG: ABC transporter ATP-binding protein [Bacteroidales bacterium]|nr:ABC transporter ATP-binding protein [Bacteroidales bacterium]